jgi:drug/metabolite transporter (DMT)-like permease
MFDFVPPQLIALCAALSYAVSGISAKRGMRYSTPITVTLVSLLVHAGGLWMLLGTWLFLRGIEGLNRRTILGAMAVVAGTLAIVVR